MPTIRGALATQHRKYQFGRGKMTTCRAPETTASNQAFL
jgi:hypothetical protein